MRGKNAQVGCYLFASVATNLMGDTRKLTIIQGCPASDNGTPLSFPHCSFTLYTSPYVPLPIRWISSKSSCGFLRDRSTLEFIIAAAAYGAERARCTDPNDVRKQIFFKKKHTASKDISQDPL